MMIPSVAREQLDSESEAWTSSTSQMPALKIGPTKEMDVSAEPIDLPTVFGFVVHEGFLSRLNMTNCAYRPRNISHSYLIMAWAILPLSRLFLGLSCTYR
jgi:hypothetical protein